MADETGLRRLRLNRREPEQRPGPPLRPYQKPLSVALWGNDSPALAEQLLSLCIDAALDRPARCEASFLGAGPGSPVDRRLLDFGKEITVSYGGEPLFRGRIDALGATYPEGGSPQVDVRAADGLEELRQAVRSRTFQDVTDIDAIEAIARDYALAVRLEGVEPGPVRRSLVQLERSDLDFVVERARAIDAFLQLDGWTLVLRARSRPSEAVPLALGRDLHGFSALADLETQRTRIDVGGWDRAAAVPADGAAGEEVVRAELLGASGAAVLRAAVGERAGSVGGPRTLAPAEAHELASAAFRARARAFVTGRGVATGTPALRPGCDTELSGLGAPFDGRYRVTRVVHHLDADGLRSELEVERPGLGEPA